MTNNIKILQHFYTSCKKGLSGAPGYQTRAESEGLDPTERKELVENSNYELPSELKNISDEKQYPVIFKSLRLQSGKIAVIRSNFVGLDYSKRGGNFFAHSLVFDGQIQKFWTIDFFKWNGWKSSLTSEEEDTDPTPLPVLGIYDLISSYKFTFEELKIFLNRYPNRPDFLRRMITSVFFSHMGSESILIRESEADNLNTWIAILLKSFPPKCVSPLSYDTFLFDSSKSKNINATLGTTKINFDKNVISYQFNFFDQVDSNRSVVTNRINNALKSNSPYLDYANTIVNRILNSPQKLNSFFEYANLFNFSALSPELNILYQIFSIYDEDNLSFSNSEITNIMQFLVKYGTKESIDLIMNPLISLTEKLKESSNINDWYSLIDFYIIMINQYNKESDISQLIKLYSDLYDNFIITKQLFYNEINNKKQYILTNISKNSSIFNNEISVNFISQKHLNFIKDKSKTFTSLTLKVIINDLYHINNFLNFKTSHLFEDPDISSALETFLFDSPERLTDLAWYFDPFKNSESDLLYSTIFIFNLLQKNLNIIKRDDVIKSLGSTLSDILFDKSYRYSLLSNLLKYNLNSEIILHSVLCEWLHNIKQYDSPNDKIKANQDYLKNIIDINLGGPSNDTSKKLLNPIVQVFLDMLPDDLRDNQSFEWLSSNVKDGLNDKNLLMLSKNVTPYVSFKPSDNISDQLYSILSDLYKNKKFHQFPGVEKIRERLYFRYAASKIFSFHPSIDKDLKEELSSASPETYSEFSNTVFNHLFSLATTVKSHNGLINVFMSPNNSELFKSLYINFIDELPQPQFTKVELNTILFWLQFNSENALYASLYELRNPILQCLTNRISYLPKDLFNKAITDLNVAHKLSDIYNQGNIKKFIDKVYKTKIPSFKRLISKTNFNFYVFKPKEER
jgi:hypothetical protein